MNCHGSSYNYLGLLPRFDVAIAPNLFGYGYACDLPIARLVLQIDKVIAANCCELIWLCLTIVMGRTETNIGQLL